MGGDGLHEPCDTHLLAKWNHPWNVALAAKPTFRLHTRPTQGCRAHWLAVLSPGDAPHCTCSALRSRTTSDSCAAGGLPSSKDVWCK